jgi:hypothetical protein
MLLSTVSPFLLILSAAASAAAAGSGLPPTVSINPAEPAPGTQVQVTGLDFPPSSPIELRLVTDAGVTTLGTVTTTDNGMFAQVVSLPATVVPGYWEMRASGPDRAVAVRLFVPSAAPAGAAPAPDAETTTATVPGVAPGLAGTPVPQESPLLPNDLIVVVVLLGLAIGIAVAAFFTWRVTHRREGDPNLPQGDDPIWSGVRGSR